jgi:hypothetical protein
MKEESHRGMLTEDPSFEKQQCERVANVDLALEHVHRKGGGFWLAAMNSNQ